MKGRLTTSILSYLESPKAFRFLRAGKLYWLLLLSSASLLIGSSAVVAIAVPQRIAQAIPGIGISRPTLKVGSQGERVSELQAALKLLGFYSGTVDGIYNDDTANAVSRFKRAVDLSPDGIVDATTWQRLFPKEPIVTPTVSANNSTSNLTNFPVPTQPTRVVNPSPLRPNPALSPQPQPKPATTTVRPSSLTPNRVNTSTTNAGQIPGVQYTSQGWPILRLGMRNAEVRKLQERLKQLGFLASGIDGDFGPTTEAAVKAAQQRYNLEPDGVVGGATWEALLRRSPGQR
ncbi:MAG: peptidoglycan-binding protein [Trichormus sp. ATA11-4-KO1]|jgi:peptidoglycan hydrolase-like protein with peptidoglycan-binding domain|nr:peptidoglycan-binding protein [Trichormus sp. ATA11-4-KO1]